MTEERIQELIAKGAKRWTKGNNDRLYVDAYKLGLETSRYKTGNICSAQWQGETISNSQANKLIGASIYYNLKTDKVSIAYTGNLNNLTEVVENFFSK